ncbi:MAG: radical SAM protein [Clostridiales bacterium]|jgi:radical SAM superfamily enzyme YgiQ (UPF0313 family)|nr:radical SAM protein [Clostridiales bacterium]
MRILIISPKIGTIQRQTIIPLGMLSVATHLKNCGHTVTVCDRIVDKRKIGDLLRNFKPDFVGVSMMYVRSYRDAVNCSLAAKSCGAKVVWGGHLVTQTPEATLKEDCVDYIVTGEGEFTWQALLECLSSDAALDNVKGIGYKNNGKIHINPEREFADPADLPVLDFDILRPEPYFQSSFSCKKMLYMYASKGCPGHCAFCFNPEYNKSCCRRRPIENVIKEIRCVVEEHGADGIYFADELWCGNNEELVRFCNAYRDSGINFVWGCQMRVGIIAAENFKLMYDCGCRWIFFGVESGSTEKLKEMHKGISLDNVRQAAQNASDAGIVAITSFIVGFPGETEQQLRDTAVFASSLDCAMLFCSFFSIIIGSEYHRALVAQGKLKKVERLSDILDYPSGEYLKYNFTEVPSRDLKVVYASLMWHSFTKKGTSPEKVKHSFALKVMAEAVRGLFSQGILRAPLEAFILIRTFFDIVFNLTCFPGIRKKYGLK